MATRNHVFLSATVALLAISFPIRAQTFVWQRVATGGPPARGLPAMTFDSLRNRSVLHGGSVSFNVDFGDTWEWDGSTWAWRSFDGPWRRYGHALEYDPVRQQSVMFGGASTTVSLPAETWTWDGTVWAQPAVGLMPTSRYGHAMAWDPGRGRIVLFGGGYLPQNDTWDWDGAQWIPHGGFRPPARLDHAMAYDPVGARVLLFGGVDFSNGSRRLFGDTWAFDGTQWMQLLVPGPSPRDGHRMVSDSQRGRVVLFGGGLGETHEWDGTAWQQTASMGPEVRVGFAMTYDSSRGRVVLFGTSIATNGSETWEFGPAVAATAQNYGTGCGAPALSLTPDPQGRPVLGGTARAAVANVPAGAAFVALGTSNTLFGGVPLPLDLGAFGLPGCWLWHSAELAFAWPTTPGPANSAAFAMPVPNALWLVGMVVHGQAWAPAPGANAGGLLTSDAVEWRIGHL